MRISRIHATFVRSGGSWTVEDLHSASGTYLNEERFSGQAPLKDGDVIRLGGVIVEFVER
jgi:pSer/pThr/pTyr-binding forkhead associated (FHA) protein